MAQEEVNQSVVNRHSELTDNEPEKHRLIDDSIESTIALWSSQKIQAEIEKLISSFTPRIINGNFTASIGDYILSDTATSLVVDLPQSSASTSGKLIIMNYPTTKDGWVS